MPTTLLIGLDGTATGERAVKHAKQLATLIGDCELLVVYVIEWSPFSFQTAEENEQRHKRRKEEIAAALSRIVDPAVKELTDAGFSARGLVRHGDVAESLIRTATDEGAAQIIVARMSEGGFVQRFMGSATASLVMSAPVPVTVVA
ncbi:universal stress protein [Oceaniovalibus sp. ACAM 378]|uniref:universal stress protein n=1 Tax=Oceaniovalibus sp. ACAM 378 TaxID=2599923 RepID=UPI0011DB5275|nr:universal stress protein [Oceaniovalibus sp. ACAM 378]TYB90286.1 universal stress protein [Oceaniovalibus sp. ACAM 378]